jgi:hypothetical protein
MGGEMPIDIMELVQYVWDFLFSNIAYPLPVPLLMNK